MIWNLRMGTRNRLPYFLLAFAAVAVGAQPKATAFNKATLEAYVRHLYVWAPPIDIQIGDPKPAPMAGFQEVMVHASQGKLSHDEMLYVSNDGQKILRGQVFDVAQNPFKATLDVIKTDQSPGFGTAGAPVVLVEFSDFQCPYCREEAQTLRTNLLKDYPKDVRLYFLDYPIDQLHPWARPAAIAGRCIFRQNPAAFWDYHDWIFAHQGEITAENLKAKVLEFAKTKEIDGLQLTQCMDTKATEAEIQKSMAMGAAAGVNSTPFLFINGRPSAGTTPWTDLKRVIDYEIEYQKTAKNAGDDCGCSLNLPAVPTAVGPTLK